MLHATSWCASQRSLSKAHSDVNEPSPPELGSADTYVRNIRLRCPKFEDAVRVNGTFSASIIALNPCKLTPAARYRQRRCQKRPLRRQKNISYAFLVTVCRFKVSGLTFKVATGCAVDKYRWDMTPTASAKLTATNPAEKSCELSCAL